MKKQFCNAIVFQLLSVIVFSQKPARANFDQQLQAVSMEKLKAYVTPDVSRYRICIDQPLRTNLPPRKENEMSNLPSVGKDGKLSRPTTLRQGLTATIDKMWSPGDSIKVGFHKTETTETIISKVKQYAKHWEIVANIKFLFVDNIDNAQVKVGFQAGYSWAWLGRDILDNPSKFRTMNYGWFTDETPEAEFRRVVVHEFGHVLGLVHEHGSPTVSIPWNKDTIYKIFQQPPTNWTKEQVDRNVFEKYSIGESNYSSYDKNSIMHYYFPPEFTNNQTVFYFNNNMSPIDVRFAGIFYPFPVNPTGTLLTGDDCDEIDFKIEYNVVNKTVVEFVLEPGIDNRGNKVTWWKQAGIPVNGGAIMNLEFTSDAKANSLTLIASHLDKGRALYFSKAKALGVHTLLPFRWDVLPAIIGGCRVKLTWRNDHCY